ncbi:MAG TPA: NADPH:quinone reductase [Mycobacteriales bacterium]|nr:NADPH:quinone reductase [Mycobacteriales bacterium]
MKAIVYRPEDGAELRLVDRSRPEPGPGEVLVRIALSGVNPTDWKARRSPYPGTPQGVDLVPHQDGAGTIEAVGPGVTDRSTGQAVWLWEAAWRRADGTAQELVALPALQAVPLPDGASLELGASLGVPALTAHRCLTIAEGGPQQLAAGALTGRTVLVAGGAGAVGHAAIELARWAGARVLSTVSGPEKAALAEAAGAHSIINYRADDAVEAVHRAAPDGVDVIVEVAPSTNAALDCAVVAPGGAIAAYASEQNPLAALPVRDLMSRNARWQFVLLYTMPDSAKSQAVAAISAALADGALRVGADAGLPLHRFRLQESAAAQEAVRAGAVGKVLVDVPA